MMQMLVRQGIPAENILGGVGKATAYLAVQLKKTPEAAAEFAAKMQDATGTASEDMMGLFDTIQKAFYLGVDDTNMLSFFTKTSSVLKMVNKDGLQAAQSLAPISVMMDQMGMNGESAGNALRKVIQSGLSVKKIRDVNKVMARQKLGIQLDFTDGKGSFGGLDNMFRQLAKLRKLTDVMNSFHISTSQTGWCKFPNGLILQWGLTPTIFASGSVSYPIPFPGGCLFVGKNTYSPVAEKTAVFEIVNPSMTGFTAANIGSLTQGSSTFNAPIPSGMAFFAIGY